MKVGWSITKLPKSDKCLELAYREGGSIPWSLGYKQGKDRYIGRVLSDSALLGRFQNNNRLPEKFGVGIDERCVEIPWLIGHLQSVAGRVLDAGSALNHEYILNTQPLSRMKMHIMTLFPEKKCYWQRGISYIYDDLRCIPIKDRYYDAIACVSTLEHVGCDNSIYTSNDKYIEDSPEEVIVAVKEIRRVLKPGGTLFLTVPFGRYSHLGWSQQFDSKLLSRVVQAFGATKKVNESYYRYSAEGWQVAEPEDCAECSYVEWISRAWYKNEWPNPIPVEPDYAAAARAVACLELVANS